MRLLGGGSPLLSSLLLLLSTQMDRARSPTIKYDDEAFWDFLGR